MPQTLSIGGDEKRFHTVGNILEFWYHRVVRRDRPNNVVRPPKKAYPLGVFFQVGKVNALRCCSVNATGHLWRLHEPSANLVWWEWQRFGSGQ
jgi:hypothetical protein